MADSKKFCEFEFPSWTTKDARNDSDWTAKKSNPSRLDCWNLLLGRRARLSNADLRFLILDPVKGADQEIL